jgi:hypothetical protein
MFTTVISPPDMRVCLGLVSASGLARTPSRAPQDRSSVREGDAEQALSTAARKLRCLS